VGTMAIVMLYQTTVKSDAIEKMDELRNGFRVIYEKHSIDVVGRWKSVDQPQESYYMVQYDNEDDYQNKTRTLHDDEEYLRLSSQLNEIRTDFRSTKLTPK
jgi:hypothetical protein